MITKTKCVLFTFPGVCPTCEQELSDEGEAQPFSEQKVTINDIMESGTPLCPICDTEIWPDNECEVRA